MVSKAALLHNIATLRGLAGAPLLVPFKANAYGHGAALLAPFLADCPHIWGFAVATPYEAFELRAALPNRKKEILLFGASFPDEWPELVAAGVQLTLSDVSQIGRLPAGARVHLKVNTGMHRLGASISDAPAAAEQLKRRGMLAGLYSHFTDSEIPEDEPSKAQLARFQSVALLFPEALHHMANSGAILRGRAAGLGLARPGLAVYGVSPLPEDQPSSWLKPVMSFQGRVMHLHSAAEGERVGYNGIGRMPADGTIATVSIGYADGYPRGASGFRMRLDGGYASILGRVCMDQLMLDVTGLNVKLGDWATAWGADPSLHELATQAGTSPYEVMVRPAERVARVLVD